MNGVSNHAELMDSIYRHQRYFYDFTRKYYLFGRDRLIRELALGQDERLIEVGCGTARNLIAIARRYPGARLYGLDASHEMLKTAEQAIRKAGLEDRIVLAHGYAEALSPTLFGETAPFDICVFSYSLSMIPQWKQALKAAAAVLSPRGRIQVVDFGDMTGLGRVGRAAMLGWLKLFHVAPRAELLESFECNNSARLTLLFGRYAFLLTGQAKDF